MTSFEWADVTTLKRDRWERPLITPPGGGKPEPYTRCTTFAGTIKDLNSLMSWKARQTAVGLAVRPDLAARVASLGPIPDGDAEAKAWKSEINKTCDAAQEAAGSSTGANLGTAIHAFTEAIDRGRTDIPIPDKYLPHIASYQEVTDGWTMVAIEAFLVNDGLKIGGTADRIVEIPGETGRFIADVKTGSIAQYPHDAALQLAIYAHSVHYSVTTGVRTPVPGLRQDKAIIVALDAHTGECRAYWIDIASGWEAVRIAYDVRNWRAKKDLLSPVVRVTPSTPTQRTAENVVAITRAKSTIIALQVAINAAETQEALVALWQVASERGEWTDELTELARSRMTSLLASA